MMTTPTSIELAGGGYLDLWDPDPAAIDIGDIASALSKLCRFTGHTSRFYSVAEHSVLVADLLASQGLSREIQLGGLLHDAHEAYVGDLSTPLKRALRRGGFGFSHYDELVSHADGAVLDSFGLEHFAFTQPAVKAADQWAMKIEADSLMPSRGQWIDADGGPLPDSVTWRGGLFCKSAEHLFLHRYHELTA